MSFRAPRPALLGLASAMGCLMLAGAAQAQNAAPGADGQAAGLRYMSWAGRTTGTAMPVTASGHAANGVIPHRVASFQSLARPTMQAPQRSAPQPQPVSRGLTPASAWLNPQPTPASAPGTPDPTAYATTGMSAPQPTWTPAPVQPQPQPAPQPVYGGPQPAMTEAPQPRPAPSDAAFDPMAPRRDAPIFRMSSQDTAPAPQASSVAAEAGQAAPQTYAQAAPAGSPTGQPGARYYSVHREAGHQPDRTPLPEAVYFDSVALDLAEPPTTEPPQRDAQGRLRPVPNEDPSLP